jgi:hypothetical protein
MTLLSFSGIKMYQDEPNKAYRLIGTLWRQAQGQQGTEIIEKSIDSLLLVRSQIDRFYCASSK